MKKKYIIVGLLILIMALSLGNQKLVNRSLKDTPLAENGFMDLSEWDFLNDGPIELRGQWSFYFNTFLMHEDFGEGTDVPSYAVTIPSTKKSMGQIKPFDKDTYYGTLRLVIQLPETDDTYGLRSEIVLTAYELYVNGQKEDTVGKIGRDVTSSYPSYKVANTFFDVKNHTLELIYHTSDFHFEDSAIIAPTFGLAKQIAYMGEIGLGRDLFLFGILLIMGIYHLSLYWMRRKDASPLYFGLFCLLFATRMLLVGERFIPNIFDLDIMIYVRIAYISVFLGFSALCGYIYHTVYGLFPKRFQRLAWYMGGIASLLTLFIQVPSISILLILYFVVGFIMLIYSMFRLGIGIYRRYKYATGLLFGFVILSATFINDFIYELTLMNSPSLIPLGISIFVFTQAYIIASKFSSAFSLAEHLSVEKESMLLELKHVNANLENMVEIRTQDLQKALDEMAYRSMTDDLTKLPNRRAIMSKLEEVAKCGKRFSIGLIDVDNFKSINDSYGHKTGDWTLIALSEAMKAYVGSKGIIGRWGGEEFLLVLYIDDAEEAMKLANGLREYVAGLTFEAMEANITITIGLSVCEDRSSLDYCINQADEALYLGKKNGRNQCRQAKR
ncbi:sensor domain-containing diguanylate cyclase [Petrocella sp. FN5]|uniref:sensor domain-containing diguanylate cyclase n=1 Tax=Petrocella sp. FN5 TaxID=3032002 RepID=UPI0023DC26E9|nr:diguanylate cyclase [Petrocella sp. FN5]MDF1617386.1 GGDEF domain-containing protein [Petrocella sp. FN5]